MPARSRWICAAAILAVVGSGCATLTAAEPGPAGEILVNLDDFRFSPDVIRVQAGEQVTFVLRNVGNHAHEFMVGRNPHFEKNYLDGPLVEPFETDFFAGIEAAFEGQGMPMNLEGVEGMGDMDMDDMDMSEDGMDMGHDEDDGGDGHDDEMNMGDEATEMGDDGHADDGGGGVMLEPSGEGEDDEEAHHGGMVMLDADQVARLTLTIPADKVGEWQIGCFEEDGGHFEDGMRATLIVEG